MRSLALLLAAVLMLARAGRAQAATVRVDITPGHVANQLNPRRALGAGVDAQPAGAVDLIYSAPTLNQMLSAGWGSVSYRLFTELSAQDWHWNPAGTWSDPAGRGYFTGASGSAGQIATSYSYRLPHRGLTHDQGTDDDYSRLVDGGLATYWKSNPYLTAGFTGEADSLHPQWIVVDLAAVRAVSAARLVWEM